MSAVTTFENGFPCWVDVTVATSEQYDQLKIFYSSLFGWKFDGGSEDSNHYSIAHHNEQPVMAISVSPDATGEWLLYFSTDNLEKSIERAVEAGGTVMMEPMPVMDIGRMALIMDTGGVVYGIWKPITFHGFGVMFEENAPSWFDQKSTQWDVATEYYCKTLEVDSMTPEPRGSIFHRGESWIASTSIDDCVDVPAHWTPVIMVASLAQSRDTAKKLGAKIVVEEQNAPGCILSVIRNPVTHTDITIMQGL